MKTAFTDGGYDSLEFKTNVGDIYTTNLIETTTEDVVAAGDLFEVNATGILEQVEQQQVLEPMTWQVAKKYTLADGQVAVKIQRIA